MRCARLPDWPDIVSKFHWYSRSDGFKSSRVQGLQGFRVTRLQGYRGSMLRVQRFKSSRVSELQNFRVTEFQTCPTDIYNAEFENDRGRSGGVTEFQGLMAECFETFRVLACAQKPTQKPGRKLLQFHFSLSLFTLYFTFFTFFQPRPKPNRSEEDLAGFPSHSNIFFTSLFTLHFSLFTLFTIFTFHFSLSYYSAWFRLFNIVSLWLW
jgi:hypothetical protein